MERLCRAPDKTYEFKHESLHIQVTNVSMSIGTFEKLISDYINDMKSAGYIVEGGAGRWYWLEDDPMEDVGPQEEFVTAVSSPPPLPSPHQTILYPNLPRNQEVPAVLPPLRSGGSSRGLSSSMWNQDASLPPITEEQPAALVENPPVASSTSTLTPQSSPPAIPGIPSLPIPEDLADWARLGTSGPTGDQLRAWSHYLDALKIKMSLEIMRIEASVGYY